MNEPKNKGGRPATQPCGTPAAYRRHRRRREEPCEACRTAMSAWNAEQYQRRTKG